jgi:hypothetical protein
MTGGLGNQIFQFAAGLALAERLGVRLLLDVQSYETDPLRRYRLDELVDPPEVIQAHELARLLEPGWFSRKVLGRRPLRTLKHRKASFLPEVLSLESPCFLDGYWQSERYFEAVSDAVRRRIDFRCDPGSGLVALASSGRIASVHIRRGDYVNVTKLLEWHGVLPLEYYHQGLREIDGRFGLDGVFVFTDDPEWARSEFRPKWPMTMVSAPGSDELVDLAVMKACRFHVIANSSFSWWGAWLSDAAPEAVIAPKRWFAAPAEDCSNIVPKRWKRT